MKWGWAQFLSLFSLGAMTCSGAAAWAQGDPSPTLTWQAPAGCPGGATVLGNVQRILADVSRPIAAAAVARVTVVSGVPWQATLVLDVGGTRTERRFQAESCDAIAEAAALIIALAVEPAAPLPVPQAEDPYSPPAAPTPPPPAADGSWLVVTGNGLVDWSTMPRPPSDAIEVGAGWKRNAGRWRQRLMGSAAFLLPRNLPESRLEVFGDYWGLVFDARGCAGVAIGRIELTPCGGAELAIMHASTTVVSVDTLPTVTQTWFSFLASLGASVNITDRLGAFIRGDVVRPIERPTFGTRDGIQDVPLYKIPAVAFRVGFGLEFVFR